MILYMFDNLTFDNRNSPIKNQPVSEKNISLSSNNKRKSEIPVFYNIA